jgi:hypothetical protein
VSNRSGDANFEGIHVVLAGLLAMAAFASGGCTAWERPAATDSLQEESRQLSTLRQPGPDGQLMGIDERARQIERNLGLR